MKIYMSYFYQIRNFPKTLVPVSTARHDPKWFQQQGDIFLDKRGVINGLRIEALAPSSRLVNCCRGPKYCTNLLDEVCPFLGAYYEELCSQDFQDVMADLESYSSSAQAWLDLDAPADIALIVYEAPDRKCSERGMIQRWFKEHGVLVEEWRETDAKDEYVFSS